jgi:hypothetical protein
MVGPEMSLPIDSYMQLWYKATIAGADTEVGVQGLGYRDIFQASTGSGTRYGFCRRTPI